MDLYDIGRRPILWYFKIVHRLQVIGAEDFPKENGILLCSNHVHNLDPPLLGSACPRNVHFMAKAELYHVPVLKSLLPRIHAFPVKRGSGDRQALRSGLKLLEGGEVMGLFPEGTRSKNDQLGEGLSGAGYFALRSTADIVPCAIIGSYIPFKKMKIVFGAAIDFSDLREQKTPLKVASTRIMNAIKALIDEHETGPNGSNT